MPIEPVTHLEKTIAGTVEPVTHLEQVISEYGGGSGGGAVSSVNGKTGNVMLTAEDVGAAPAETVVEVSGTTPTITPAPNTIYKCGEVASLTISNPTATGAYSVIFTSGATATDLSIPPDLKMPDGFTVEANRRYEINVSGGYAVAGSWAVSE